MKSVKPLSSEFRKGNKNTEAKAATGDRTNETIELTFKIKTIVHL